MLHNEKVYVLAKDEMNIPGVSFLQWPHLMKIENAKKD